MFRTVTVYRGEKIAVRQGWLVNAVILWEGKRMRVRNAIDKYVSSLTTAITRLQPNALKIPVIPKPDIYNDIDD